MAISTRTIKAMLRKQKLAEIEAKKTPFCKDADKLKAKVKSWLKKNFGLSRYDYSIGIYHPCSEDPYSSSNYSISVCYFKGNKIEVNKKLVEDFGCGEFKGHKMTISYNKNYEDMDHYTDFCITIYE